MHPKVSIIILHLEEVRCLIDCVASLNKATYENCDIFIVHNGPKSKVLEENLAPISQRITEVIDTGENVGFARGNNIGIRQALQKGAEYVLLLNDDTVVSPEFLDILVNTAENRADVGILGPKIYYYDERKKISFVGARFDAHTCTVSFPGANQLDHGQFEEVEEADFVTGCAMLVKREVIEKVGALNGRFFLYWEDVDWGVRAKKAGIRSLVVPTSKIWHKASISSGGHDSPLKIYHKTRSHLLMARLHTKRAISSIVIGFLFDVLWLLFKSSGVDRDRKARAYVRAILDFYMGRIDKGPRWLWSGLGKMNASE